MFPVVFALNNVLLFTLACLCTLVTEWMGSRGSRLQPNALGVSRGRDPLDGFSY